MNEDSGFVALDPGTTSGVVWVKHLGRGFDGAGGIDIDDCVWEEVGGGWEYASSFLYRFIVGAGVDVVVIEDFLVRAPVSVAAKRTFLDPVRVTCALVGRLREKGWTGSVVYQSASSGKGVVTDSRLKRWGLWVKGSPHVRDALRHAVVYARGL